MHTINVTTSRMPPSAGTTGSGNEAGESNKIPNPELSVLIPSGLNKALETVAELGHNQRRKERPRKAKDIEREKEGQEGDEKKEAGMGNRTQVNATSILQGLCPGQE